MKFALHAVGCGSTARPEVLGEVARKAEALGFESVWIPEHLLVPVAMRTPYPYSADGRFPGGPAVASHDEFEAVGMPYADRAARAREAIRLMRTLWSVETPSFAGRFHQVPACGFSPGFVPRAKLVSDLYPAMARFAAEHIRA